MLGVGIGIGIGIGICVTLRAFVEELNTPHRACVVDGDVGNLNGGGHCHGANPVVLDCAGACFPRIQIVWIVVLVERHGLFEVRSFGFVCVVNKQYLPTFLLSLLAFEQHKKNRKTENEQPTSSHGWQISNSALQTHCSAV